MDFVAQSRRSGRRSPLPAQFQHHRIAPKQHGTWANRIGIRTSTGRHRPTNSNNQQPTTRTNNQEPPGRTRSPDETGRSQVASKDAIDPQIGWRSSSFALFLRIVTNCEPAAGWRFETTKPRFQNFLVANPFGYRTSTGRPGITTTSEKARYP